jgi:hypothetical protein
MDKNELRNRKRMLRQLPLVQSPETAALRAAFQDALQTANVRSPRSLVSMLEKYGMPRWSKYNGR